MEPVFKFLELLEALLALVVDVLLHLGLVTRVIDLLITLNIMFEDFPLICGVALLFD